MRIFPSTILPAGSPTRGRNRGADQGYPAAPVTVLPRLSPAVPTALSLKAEELLLKPMSPGWKHIASAIARAPLIDEVSDALTDSALSGQLSIQQFAAGFITERIKSRLAQCRHLELSFRISEEFDSVYAGENNLRYRIEKVNEARPTIYLSIESLQPPSRCARRVLQPRLQQLTTSLDIDLFWESYRNLIGLSRYIRLLDPRRVYDYACDHYWQERDDYLGTLEHRERMREMDELSSESWVFDPGYTYAEYCESFGVSRLKRISNRRLSDKEIAAVNHSSGYAMAQVVQRARLLFKRLRCASLPNLDCIDEYAFGAAAIVLWNDDDDTVRIFDEAYNLTMNDGCSTTDSIGVTAYQVSTVKQSQQFIASLDLFCDAVLTLDQLIDAITLKSAYEPS